MKIEIVSSSPRQESITIRLAYHLKRKLTEETNHEIGLLDMREIRMPMIEKVFSTPDKAPDEFKHAAERVFAAQAFIIVTPEYNGSYSPAMKNFFDHFPKQMHKAFGIATASDGIMGGIRASQQVQLLINGLFGIGSPSMLITPQVDKKFDEQGNLLDESFQNKVSTFLTEFLWLAERIAAS
ncbi:MAG: NAD(P)H-dependent oxidoreductase [Chitinophagales bacterium]|nr:NAD(P)H-dependent oxidoreductase [Chitinophagales bacterium]